MLSRCDKWLDKNKTKAPVLVFDLNEVHRAYNEFKLFFPKFKPYYAVKANPHMKVIKLLSKLGSCFDAASISEIKTCIKENVNPQNISYGNTIKKSEDILKAHKMGINLFAFDSEEELRKLALNAPQSMVFCRVSVPNGGAAWPLSKKFGCDPIIAKRLIMMAKELNLEPIGASFHVGSQQVSPNTWDKAITIMANLYKELSSIKYEMDFLNLGGGIPVNYLKKNHSLSYYSKVIDSSLKKQFGTKLPSNIVMEPGRLFVARAGVIETEVILVAKKAVKDRYKWVYLDVGRYSGLAETEGEAIHYNIQSFNKTDDFDSFILAGPSCDSHDILYEKNIYKLPKEIKAGDRLRIYSTGAYTNVYKTSFNGIVPPKEIYLDVIK